MWKRPGNHPTPAEAEAYLQWVMKAAGLSGLSPSQVTQSYIVASVFALLGVLYCILLAIKLVYAYKPSASARTRFWIFRALHHDRGVYIIPNGTNTWIICIISFYALSSTQWFLNARAETVHGLVPVTWSLFVASWIPHIIGAWLALCSQATSFYLLSESLCKTRNFGMSRLPRPWLYHSFLLIGAAIALVTVAMLICQIILFRRYSHTVQSFVQLIGIFVSGQGTAQDEQMLNILFDRGVDQFNYYRHVLKAFEWFLIFWGCLSFMIYLPFSALSIQTVLEIQRMLKQNSRDYFGDANESTSLELTYGDVPSSRKWFNPSLFPGCAVICAYILTLLVTNIVGCIQGLYRGQNLLDAMQIYFVVAWEQFAFGLLIFTTIAAQTFPHHSYVFPGQLYSNPSCKTITNLHDNPPVLTHNTKEQLHQGTS